MSDNFPITIDVEEDKVGPVLRQLDTMPGVVTIHLRMNKAKHDTALLEGQMKPKKEPAGILPSFVKRKLTGKHLQKLGASSVRGTIAQALGQGRTVHYTILGKMLEKTGLSYHSIHSALTKMSGDKVIERVGPGTYRLTKAGERKYLGIDNPRHVHRITAAYGGEVNNRKGLRSYILNALSQHPYEQSELKNLLIENDYSSNNMYNVVPKMREEGLIHKENDTYTITDRGREALTPIELEVIEPEQHQQGDNT